MDNKINTAINKYIDNHQVSKEILMDSFPWINESLAKEEIGFWIDNSLLINNGNKLIRTKKNTRRKLLFLDIDGVLNHSNSKDDIDDECLSNLKYIYDNTKCTIILISSWKSGWFKKEKYRQDSYASYLDKRLKEVNLKIYDKSSRYAYPRTFEVVDYIMKFNTHKYVILDDDCYHYKDCELYKHLVRTSASLKGLTREKADKAIRILTQKCFTEENLLYMHYKITLNL